MSVRFRTKLSSSEALQRRAWSAYAHTLTLRGGPPREASLLDCKVCCCLGLVDGTASVSTSSFCAWQV